MCEPCVPSIVSVAMSWRSSCTSTWQTSWSRRYRTGGGQNTVRCLPRIPPQQATGGGSRAPPDVLGGLPPLQAWGACRPGFLRGFAAYAPKDLEIGVKTLAVEKTRHLHAAV